MLARLARDEQAPETTVKSRDVPFTAVPNEFDHARTLLTAQRDIPAHRDSRAEYRVGIHVQFRESGWS